MIAAVDVYYSEDGLATAGAVVFSDFGDSQGLKTYVRLIRGVKNYVPGEFYKRELPCLLEVLNAISEEIDTIIIDGYVDLGIKPGLGRHLWKALGCRKTIIGVAKTYFHGSDAVKIHRGKSRQPLYITSAGIEQAEAAGLIAGMHGKFRLPTLLKKADFISRTEMARRNPLVPPFAICHQAFPALPSTLTTLCL
jgi:deoxyribonuclease V